MARIPGIVFALKRARFSGAGSVRFARDGRAVRGLAVRGTGISLQLILDHELVIAYTMSPTKRRKDSFSTNCL